MEDPRASLKPGEVFYYADPFHLSFMPTVRARWSPKGQQVMMATPGQPTKLYLVGAVPYHPGETVVRFRRHKRRRDLAQLLPARRERPPGQTLSGAWENANTHEDEDVEAVLRGAAGRLVLG